jgi:hypothetical protein
MRTERNRQLELARRIDNLDPGQTGGGTARFVGQVYTAGTLPTCTPCIYLTHPVQLGGTEGEGAGGGPAVDSSRSVPVVVLGPRAPAVGDLLVAHSAGGRWVAERGSGIALTHCFGTCVNPDLHVDWFDTQITDDNGTWFYYPNGRNQPGSDTFYISKHHDSGVYIPPNLPGSESCPGRAGRATYGYGIACDRPGYIGIRQFVYYTSCVDPIYPILYVDPTEFPGLGQFPGAITPTIYVVPDSLNPIRATFSAFSGAGFPTGISPQSGSASIVIPVYDPTTDIYTCCSPCPIPKKDLTLSWTNSQLGNGSVPLVFTPPGQHNNSGCSNNLRYSLSCPGELIQFNVTYYLSGSCETGGQSQSCDSPGHEPFALLLADYTCSPFRLHYTVTGASCPVLGSNGYSSFTITDP